MQFDISEYFNLLKNGENEEALNFKSNFIFESLKASDGKLYKYISLDDEKDYCSQCKKISLNKKKIDSFKSKKIWVANRTTLNDPFEFSAMFINKEAIADALDKNHSRYINAINFEKVNKESVFISSFTPSNNNMAMWAHYANNHKGFCLEYKIIDSKLFYPITYLESRPDATKYLFEFLELAERNYYNKDLTKKEKQIFNIILANLKHVAFVKSNIWEYETEFRLSYPKNCIQDGSELGALLNNEDVGIEITGIYLGIDCCDEYKKTLSKIAYNLDIDVYEMVFDDTCEKFGLRYKPYKLEEVFV